MMAYLAAAVVLVGLLCLLDLVLTLAVIRRLREHTSLLSQVPRGLPAGLSGQSWMQVGKPVAEFTTTTTDGELVSRELMAGRSLVGFFAPGCQPCTEQLPEFVEHARSMPGGRAQVLAVVTGGDREESGDRGENGVWTEYLEQLAKVAQVVVEPPDGPVQTAFQVRGYPTLYLVDTGGVMAAAGTSMRALKNVPAPPVAETATA